jgi:membrane protease YdiL (CAAX protease family)
MRRVAPSRVGWALAATLVVLAFWNVIARPALPSGYHLSGGLLVAVAVVVLGVWGGLDLDGLGLAPRRLAAGAAYGAAAIAVVTGVVLLAIALPATRSLFHTGRAEVSLGKLLLELTVTIPLGTVVVEELAFRGTLLGLLCSLVPPVRAALVCSTIFGFWHVYGVVRATDGSGLYVFAAVVGTFLATVAAGVAFCWLRMRSGSLLAPALAHLATNTVALVVAWIVVH